MFQNLKLTCDKRLNYQAPVVAGRTATTLKIHHCESADEVDLQDASKSRTIAGMNRLTLTGRLFENTLIVNSISMLAHILAASKNPDGYQKYQPYGEFATEPGDAGTNIPSFTGKFADPGSGNHYFKARYHTSDTGTTKGPMQFSSPDPVYGNLSDPLSWNRYAYCRNNPVNYTDPDGRKFVFNSAQAETLFNSYINSLDKSDPIQAQYYADIMAVHADQDLTVEIVTGNDPYEESVGGLTYVDPNVLPDENGIGGKLFVQVFNRTSHNKGLGQDTIWGRANLAHELVHVVQFYKGELGYNLSTTLTLGKKSLFGSDNRIKTCGTLSYDVFDEFAAFDAAILADPMIVTTSDLMRDYSHNRNKPISELMSIKGYQNLWKLQGYNTSPVNIPGGQSNRGFNRTKNSAGEFWFHLP